MAFRTGLFVGGASGVGVAILVGIARSLGLLRLPADGSALAAAVVVGAFGFVSAALASKLLVGRRLDPLLSSLEQSQDGLAPIQAPSTGSDELARLAAAYNRLVLRWSAVEADSMAAPLVPQEQTPVAPFDTRAIELANRRLEARVQELTLLHEVTRSLTSTLEIDELLRRLTELIGATRHFESFAILLADDENGGFVVRTSYGFDEALAPTGSRLSYADETCGQVLQSRSHLFTTASTALGRERLEGLGWIPDGGTLLTLAMRHKDRVEGVLVFCRRPDDPYTADDIEILHNISGQAALALSNARLFEQTVKLSLTDPLTGLHNRRHFFAKLDLEVMRARRYGTQVSVAMFDIDHFKNLNDTSGHATGDVVLQELARLLQENVRRVDTVARFGGEEFCAILPTVTKEEAGFASEKLRNLVASTRFPGGELQPGGKLTVSVGFATFPEDADDVDSLLDAADTALYASKRSGRNRSTPYQPGLRSPAQGLFGIERGQAQAPLAAIHSPRGIAQGS